MDLVQSANSGGLSSQQLGSGHLSCYDYGWRWTYPQPTYYPVFVPVHRACTCPNCVGDCCACADCKVRRLEKRVAELEAVR